MRLLDHPFCLGTIVATRNALDTIPTQDIMVSLDRHHSCDWGDVCPEDKGANDEALIVGNRLLSVYKTPGGTVFWIITEWDRSITTVLLPEDY